MNANTHHTKPSRTSSLEQKSVMKTNNHKSNNKSDANDSSIERLLDALDQIFSLLEQFSFANISHFLSIPMQYVGKIVSRLAISGGKVGSNLFDTVLDLLTPVSTLFDQYQTCMYLFL